MLCAYLFPYVGSTDSFICLRWENTKAPTSVHSLLVSVAIDSHRLILDLLKDFHANMLLKPLVSKPEGPRDPLVLNAATLTSSPLIFWYTESGMSSTGPTNSDSSLALCASGCFSLSYLTTSSVSGNTPPLSSSLRYRGPN